MTDMFTPEERSRIMGRIPSRGNRTTELRFLRILRRFKVRGWRRSSRLPGRPDFVFHQHRVAVFVDGDFWHGNPKQFRIPKSNVDYWRRKIDANRQRDRLVNRTLKSLGWRVVRFWESSLSDGNRAIARLCRILRSRAEGAEPMRSDAAAWWSQVPAVAYTNASASEGHSIAADRSGGPALDTGASRRLHWPAPAAPVARRTRRGHRRKRRTSLQSRPAGSSSQPPRLALWSAGRV